YQLSHPVQATEAMTRLAKAFDCLTTPASKKAYDEAHFPHLKPRPPVVATSRVPTAIASDTTETTPVPPSVPAPAPAVTGPVWGQGAPPLGQGPAAPPPVRPSAEAAPAP